ncbi:NUDIX domain-containing protein [Acuticoccus mangrovi]|uniref:GDP-mannose pyrophosphatase n=1 Tax=Acuticoccus mangrovi TaxID=2796142 RepID=A0A934IRG8_9HYPH|nr:NUDIX domain-containing protein [Acuticoccus mangrovi]
MSEQTYHVHHLRSIYRGFLKLDLYDATIERGDRKVEVVREVHDHGNGAAVLPYDEARRTCLLVRQVRVPVHVAEGNGLILEVAAGVIDPEDASPAEAARREAAEELRYHVHDLQSVGMFYPMAGLVTEQMNCFLARYTPADRIESGYEQDDDEVIDVEEWGLKDLWEAFRDGRLRDGKAIVCLQALRIERPDLFV